MASEVPSVAKLTWGSGPGGWASAFDLLLTPLVTLSTHYFLWILRCHANIVP